METEKRPLNALLLLSDRPFVDSIVSLKGKRKVVDSGQHKAYIKTEYIV